MTVSIYIPAFGSILRAYMPSHIGKPRGLYTVRDGISMALIYGAERPQKAVGQRRLPR
jgi:hypothetical protein